MSFNLQLIHIQSIKAHRLPIFSGVTLCVTGIEDVSLRTKINKLVTSQGGAYAKALERPVKVTHLICSGDEETEKRRYADKFNSTGEAKIHVIWEEWFWDCLEYGGKSRR
jgi:DNA replication regulator DPB11